MFVQRLKFIVVFFIFIGVNVERSISWVIRAMSTSSSSMSAKAPLLSNNGAAVNLLDAIQDSYDGVTINMEASMEPEAFVFSLRASIQEWRQQVIIIIYLFSSYKHNSAASSVPL